MHIYVYVHMCLYSGFGGENLASWQLKMVILASWDMDGPGDMILLMV